MLGGACCGKSQGAGLYSKGSLYRVRDENLFFDPLGRPEPRLAAFSGTAPIVSRSGVFLFLERH